MQTLLSSSNMKLSIWAFGLAYLDLTSTHYKCQGQGHCIFRLRISLEWSRIWQTLLSSSDVMSRCGHSIRIFRFDLADPPRSARPPPCRCSRRFLSEPDIDPPSSNSVPLCCFVVISTRKSLSPVNTACLIIATDFKSLQRPITNIFMEISFCH